MLKKWKPDVNVKISLNHEKTLWRIKKKKKKLIKYEQSENIVWSQILLDNDNDGT